MAIERKPRPLTMEYRLEGTQLFGNDLVNGVDYKIGWCGNGSYSHYVLHRTDGSKHSWYVYVDEKCQLYRSIYAAEMRLVYNVAPREGGNP